MITSASRSDLLIMLFRTTRYRPKRSRRLGCLWRALVLRRPLPGLTAPRSAASSSVRQRRLGSTQCRISAARSYPFGLSAVLWIKRRAAAAPCLCRLYDGVVIEPGTLLGMVLQAESVEDHVGWTCEGARRALAVTSRSRVLILTFCLGEVTFVSCGPAASIFKRSVRRTAPPLALPSPSAHGHAALALATADRAESWHRC